MGDTTPPPRERQQELATLRQRVADLEAALAAQPPPPLQAPQHYADAIVETIRDPLLILTADLHVQSANPAFYQTFQVDPADTAGRLIYHLGNGQWAIPELRTLLEEILPHNTVFTDYAVTHDFEQIGHRTMLLNARRLDHLQLILLAIEDVTAHQQAEDALQLQRDWLDVTLTSIGDAVIATDTQGLITFVNPVAATLTGWPAHEARGRPIAEVFRICHAQTRQPAGNPVTRVLQDGRPVGLEHHIVLIARDGREIAIADSSAPIRAQTGALHGVVLVFRDVSDTRRLENELLRAQKIESVGVLAGGIAHDFNNLLTGILGNISLAKMLVCTPEKAVERLTEAERTCQRATALTHQLLTFAKGSLPVRQAVRLAALLQDIVPFAVRGSNVRAQLVLAEDLGTVEIDPGQMSQVLHNVVLNAVQAMPAGGIVEVQAANVLVSGDAPLALPLGRYVKMVVRDEGIGIPPEVLPKVFDPYFTTKERGSGLGLAVAYSVVAKHEGTIRIDSTVGRGTTVTIYLPATAQQAAASPGPPAVLAHRGRGRMLVVDDEEVIRDVLQEMLTHLGYTVDAVPDGEGALACYARAMASGNRYEAVILDYTLPGGMGGGEILERLHALDPQVRAILSSGYADTPVMMDFARAGFCGVIPKPYTVETLVEVLHRMLGTEER